MKLSAYFYDMPGDEIYEQVHAIFQRFGGTELGSGMVLADPGKGQRDVQYDIPAVHVQACQAALVAAGAKLTSDSPFV
jgi:hypothetical protein